MSKNAKIVAIILAILTAAGIAAWIYQLTQGLAVTGMNNGTSWGLYITCFMFFVGLSAGGLIVASSASVFGVGKYKAVARPAVLLSTVCIVAAAAFVVIDLGGPGRIFNLLTHTNLSSPLIWDVFVIAAYLVINIVYLLLMNRSGSERAIAIVSRFALPVAVLVHSVTAWIFGLEIAKAGWNSAIMAPLFVTSALDSGLALLLVVLAILNKGGSFKTEGKLFSSLAGLLAVCVAVDGFMVFCEVLTMGYSGAEGELMAALLTGSSAPLFWGEIVLGIAVPFVLLVTAKQRRSVPIVVAASVLVVAGVFLKRAWLLLTSFVNFNVAGAPGVTFGRADASSDASGFGIWTNLGGYAPTGIEIAIAVGVAALAALIYVLLAPRLFKGAGAGASLEAAGAEGADGDGDAVAAAGAACAAGGRREAEAHVAAEQPT
jgi:molybdopterin-containing oxidoreductase family membrane subunit